MIIKDDINLEFLFKEFTINNCKIEIYKREKDKNGLLDNIDLFFPYFSDDNTEKNSMIVDVLHALPKDDYNYFIKDLFIQGSMGYNGWMISYSEDLKKTVFYLDTDLEYKGYLSYPNTILFFQKYFTAFRDFVKEYAQEEKEKEWYKDFLIQLHKLNSVEVTVDITPEDMKKVFEE